jgi:hypothetical protein
MVLVVAAPATGMCSAAVTQKTSWTPVTFVKVVQRKRWSGVDWIEVKACRCRRGWLAGVRRVVWCGVVVGSAAVEVKSKVRQVHT